LIDGSERTASDDGSHRDAYNHRTAAMMRDALHRDGSDHPGLRLTSPSTQTARTPEQIHQDATQPKKTATHPRVLLYSPSDSLPASSYPIYVVDYSSSATSSSFSSGIAQRMKHRQP